MKYTTLIKKTLALCAGLMAASNALAQQQEQVLVTQMKGSYVGIPSSLEFYLNDEIHSGTEYDCTTLESELRGISTADLTACSLSSAASDPRCRSLKRKVDKLIFEESVFESQSTSPKRIWTVMPILNSRDLQSEKLAEATLRLSRSVRYRVVPIRSIELSRGERDYALMLDPDSLTAKFKQMPSLKQPTLSYHSATESISTEGRSLICDLRSGRATLSFTSQVKVATDRAWIDETSQALYGAIKDVDAVTRSQTLSSLEQAGLAGAKLTTRLPLLKQLSATSSDAELLVDAFRLTFEQKEGRLHSRAYDSSTSLAERVFPDQLVIDGVKATAKRKTDL